MMRVKKPIKSLDFAVSAYPNETNNGLLSSETVVSQQLEKKIKEKTKISDVVIPRKLNKIEQAKETLIQWIFECIFFI